MPVIGSGGVQVIEVSEDAVNVTVQAQPVQVVTVGIPGPQGIPGPVGPVGPAGPGFSEFVWNQGTPATVWAVLHELGRYPQVTVVDSGGNTVIGSVQYIDDDNITVTFSVSFGGVAYLT